MNIEVNKANMRIEGGKLIIDIDSNIEKLLGRKEIWKVKSGSVVNEKYIVLSRVSEGVIVIRKELLDMDMIFDECANDWRSSSLRSYLNNTYLKEVEQEFGKENILLHNTDLLSLDGLDDYGSCKDKIGLLSIDQYRRFRKLLYPVKKAWWLLTPDSTPSGGDSSCVQYVCGDGYVRYYGCGWGRGVRPFFYLKPDILVSCEN